ncbi:MAG: flavodoxin-dependent (E)-4-hydroxy-3-methylbut-2-enyl-diphosphate synthase [Candidatus Omnitrophica bacterium]|nr:flavodoxin-dependent (E)-4-hydroxy-3-methylbut-2-enyl-diphosphate synthase [Candidatus Omnitrophota bacterium]
MNLKRRKTRIVKIGEIALGGNNPIAIQSMTKVKASNVEATLRQIKELADAGCEIIRLAVKDGDDAAAIKKIKAKAKLPIVADIHFDWRLALKAIDGGVDKIRLNPGNIYKKEEIKEVVSAAKAHGIPIRVGVNSGSVRNRRVNVDNMVNSALDYLKVLEGLKFYNTVISLKASNILDTIEAYRKCAKLCDYPLHLGVTATGAPFSGAIKSSVALGALLLDGIGDTLRVSLTEDPRQEVLAAKAILSSLELRSFGPEIISCPTCGRCEVNLVKIVKELESRLSEAGYRGKSSGPLKVAVMGCVVNGPGEAKEADIGIAFGKKEGLLFKHGKPVKKVNVKDCVNVLLREILN